MQPYLDSHFVKRIYLNELQVGENTPLGVQIIQLIVAKKKQLLTRVKELIAQVKQQFADESAQLQVLNLLETIVLAKLPQMSRQELEAMFGVDDLRKTRFAQEVREEGKIEGKIEGKLETIPQLLQRRFSAEEIADILQIGVEQVQQYIESLN